MPVVGVCCALESSGNVANARQAVNFTTNLIGNRFSPLGNLTLDQTPLSSILPTVFALVVVTNVTFTFIYKVKLAGRANSDPHRPTGQAKAIGPEQDLGEKKSAPHGGEPCGARTKPSNSQKEEMRP